MNKNLLRVTALAAALAVAGGAFAATATFPGTGAGIALPDNGNLSGTATAPGPAATTNVTDLNLSVGVTHTWAGDIAITLASSNPLVAATPIISNCGGQKDYAGISTFDDSAAAPPNCVNAAGAAIGTGLSYQSTVSPTQMALFNGSAAVGPMTWTINVADDSAICTGTFDSWSVTVTTDAPVPVELSNFSVD